LIGGATLVAHLCYYFVFFGGQSDLPGFVNGMSEWFLAVHMFATLHCFHSDNSMSMVGRRDDDSIDVFFFVEHDTVIFINLRIGELIACRGCVITFVNVAKRYDVLIHAAPKIAHSHAANTDTGDIELVTWGVGAKDFAGDNVKGKCSGRGCAGGFEELSP